MDTAAILAMIITVLIFGGFQHFLVWIGFRAFPTWSGTWNRYYVVLWVVWMTQIDWALDKIRTLPE